MAMEKRGRCGKPPARPPQTPLPDLSQTPSPASDSPAADRDRDLGGPGSGRPQELMAATVGNLSWLHHCLQQPGWEPQADRKGFTAIHLAAQQGNLDCLRVLVEEYHFSVALGTSKGWTALHLTISQDNAARALDCINYLLAQGANINAQTRDGTSPLHKAAREGMLACVVALVKAGADVHSRNKRGQEPYDLCKMWKRRACARFLKDAMWKRDKKDFAQEMNDLGQLKQQLRVREQRYLQQKMKEKEAQNNVGFSNWLRQKQLQMGAPARQPSYTMSRPVWNPSLIPYLTRAFLSALASLLAPPAPSPAPETERQAWNPSTRLASSPVTQLSGPQCIRLGIHPEPSQCHDFSGFVELGRGPKGEVRLRLADGGVVGSVPHLSREVIARCFFPRLRPVRLREFGPIDIARVPRRRPRCPDSWWTDLLAISLRETLDPGFLATLEARWGCLGSDPPGLDKDHSVLQTGAPGSPPHI
ncbi:ankyrin repeat domain-containing protein 53 [Tachyglossus aculeatus]|uniref:ankyrin repeat domain-containing protein 53 n=1 Tax=Tachyglossus aculeatus TaxID=9261 RepID=UPI0018F3E1FA|nr:ankyrin repeat domain-containing protein 53 [Tachyglossus aculeatus]